MPRQQFERFVAVDEHTNTAGNYDDDQLLEEATSQRQQVDESDEDDNEDGAPCRMTKKGRQTHVDHLKWFVQEQGLDEKCVVYQALSEVKILCIDLSAPESRRSTTKFFSKTHRLTTVENTAKENWFRSIHM